MLVRMDISTEQSRYATGAGMPTQEQWHAAPDDPLASDAAWQAYQARMQQAQAFGRQAQPSEQRAQPFGQQAQPSGQQAQAFGRQAREQAGYVPGPSPQQPPLRSASVGYTPAYVTTKDHVVAALLAILLGSLGIHKFYLGYPKAGFVMLGVTIMGSLISLGLSGAVMWVFGVVEGIIYLTKSQSEFDAIYVFGRREWF